MLKAIMCISWMVSPCIQSSVHELEWLHFSMPSPQNFYNNRGFVIVSTPDWQTGTCSIRSGYLGQWNVLSWTNRGNHVGSGLLPRLVICHLPPPRPCLPSPLHLRPTHPARTPPCRASWRGESRPSARWDAPVNRYSSEQTRKTR